ncbi:MAG: hypothetical protein OXQ31_00390 [Spirochaetaceae bacterium]|nr:hypothetical protein [Spirochaetaceae bacterium]
MREGDARRGLRAPLWAEAAGLALSLVLGGLGLLAAMTWRGALFAWLERLAVYPFAVPVIDKAFMIVAGLAVLIAMLVAQHRFTDAITERRLVRRVLGAAGVTLLAFGAAHLAFAAALGPAAWSGPRLALALAELAAGIVLLLVLARRAGDQRPESGSNSTWS